MGDSDSAVSGSRLSWLSDGSAPLDGGGRCRCWHTTTHELQSFLGAATEHLDFNQLHKFVRRWHEVHQQYGPNRATEASTALAQTVRELLGQDVRAAYWRAPDG